MQSQENKLDVFNQINRQVLPVAFIRCFVYKIKIWNDFFTINHW